MVGARFLTVGAHGAARGGKSRARRRPTAGGARRARGRGGVGASPTAAASAPPRARGPATPGSALHPRGTATGFLSWGPLRSSCGLLGAECVRHLDTSCPAPREGGPWSAGLPPTLRYKLSPNLAVLDLRGPRENDFITFFLCHLVFADPLHPLKHNKTNHFAP